MNKKINGILINAGIIGRLFRNRLVEKIKQNNGNFLEEAMKYIIAAVIGVLFLGAIVLLFKSSIIPGLTEKVRELFDYRG